MSTMWGFERVEDAKLQSSGLALGILSTDNDGAIFGGTNETLREAGLPPAEKQDCMQHNKGNHRNKVLHLELDVFVGGSANKESAQTKKMPAPSSRTPTAHELGLEANAVTLIRSIGEGLGYHRLSSRVVTSAFRQYRLVLTNFERRNRVYRALSGILT
uniref:Uncharacterized protein n=1 Tax=Branchiostoma floridae TaxID=7739 RepID=C3Y886_BRAFL|eukprot:XP_002607545.1 hypothetical protein BRAFLDRAFT_106494 [Branchiostoma floridae]